MNKEVGRELAAIREAARVQQSALVAALGIRQSTLSKIEGGDLGAESEFYVRYLRALKTERAQWAMDAIDQRWKYFGRPALDHPDLPHLILAERTLARLDSFVELPNLPTTLRGQAELLRKELIAAAEYLQSLRHSVVYVGGINVGKTTALCVQAGLLLDSGPRLEGTLFDTGGGRITICDVVVRPDEEISIEVEPFSDEEVYRFVVDFCHGLVLRARSARVSAEDVGVPEEIDRAIR